MVQNMRIRSKAPKFHPIFSSAMAYVFSAFLEEQLRELHMRILERHEELEFVLLDLRMEVAMNLVWNKSLRESDDYQLPSVIDRYNTQYVYITYIHRYTDIHQRIQYSMFFLYSSCPGANGSSLAMRLRVMLCLTVGALKP